MGLVRVTNLVKCNMFRNSIIAFLALLALALAACTSATDLTYDNRSDVVVIYADLRAEGPPRLGVTCRFESIPTLRIWGDGLIFLDASGTRQNDSRFWSGKLTPDQLNDTLAALNQQGFFDNTWKPDGPNPAGDWFYIGGNLKSKTVTYSSGGLNPVLYQDLVTKLKPHLTPFALDNKPDARFDSLNIGTRECTTLK
jgi:hypothetical protein